MKISKYCCSILLNVVSNCVEMLKQWLTFKIFNVGLEIKLFRFIDELVLAIVLNHFENNALKTWFPRVNIQEAFSSVVTIFNLSFSSQLFQSRSMFCMCQKTNLPSDQYFNVLLHRKWFCFMEFKDLLRLLLEEYFEDMIKFRVDGCPFLYF